MKSVLKTFISPANAKILLDRGVSATTTFHYRKMHDGIYAIFSNDLDYLGMYSDDMLPDTISRDKSTDLPAYSIAELLQAIPGVFMSESAGVYSITGDSSYVKGVIYDRDLGTAVTRMIVALIDAKRMDPKKIISNH